MIDRIEKSSSNELHIVSLSTVSNVTGQKIPNIEEIIQSIANVRTEMEKSNSKTKILIVLDITQMVQREKINAKDGIYKNVDFFVLMSSKLIGGGFNSTNIIISKKESETYTLAS